MLCASQIKDVIALGTIIIVISLGYVSLALWH